MCFFCHLISLVMVKEDGPIRECGSVFDVFASTGFWIICLFCTFQLFSRIKYSNTYFSPQVVGWICERCWTRFLIRQNSWFLYKFQLSRRARSFNLKIQNITYLRLHFKRMTDSELSFVIWKMHTNHFISSQNFLMVKRKSLKYLEHPKKHFKKVSLLWNIWKSCTHMRLASLSFWFKSIHF